MSASDSTGTDGRRDNPGEKLPVELTAFAIRKEAHAKEVVRRYNANLPPVVWDYFAAATHGNWPEVARLGEELRTLSLPAEIPKPDPAVTSQLWSWIMEIYMAFAQFALGEPAYAFAFGRDIISSIPPGSIYFGGTDAGRGLVTALCRSHEIGDPFFTLSQNTLTDSRYLRYLREIYGGSIFIPSDEDLEHVWDEYLRELKRRKKENRLIPGEKAERVNGKIQCSNVISIMAINGAMSKLIFDRNSERQFFLEQNFPLQWAYPHLAPHRLIMAIHRQAAATISSEAVEQDLKFWSERLEQMVGDWLHEDTPVSEICAFAEKIFLRKDLAGFTGDLKYIVSQPARDAFSRLRVEIAGLYQWHARHDSEPSDQRRMAEAADFSYRQAFALNPRSPHCAFQCTGHCLGETRPADAVLVAETASRLMPENNQLVSLAQTLRESLWKKPS